MEGKWILGSCDFKDSNIFGRKGNDLDPSEKYLSYTLNCIKNLSLSIDHNSQIMLEKGDNTVSVVVARRLSIAPGTYLSSEDVLVATKNVQVKNAEFTFIW